MHKTSSTEISARTEVVKGCAIGCHANVENMVSS